MKKILLAAVVAFSSLAANAQIWVGGSLGADFTKPEGGDNVTTVTISPEVGYTLNEKWDIAVAIETEILSEDETTFDFAIEPYARYTFAKMDNVSFFVDGGFHFGKTDEKNGDKTTIKVGLRPGVKFAVNDNFGLVAKLGWLGYKNVKDSYSSFGLNLDGAVSFGAYWTF